MQGWNSTHLQVQFQHVIFTERLFLSRTLMRNLERKKKLTYTGGKETAEECHPLVKAY